MKLSTQARHALAKDLTTDVSIFIKITLKSERQRKKVVPNFITGSCNNTGSNCELILTDRYTSMKWYSDVLDHHSVQFGVDDQLVIFRK